MTEKRRTHKWFSRGIPARICIILMLMLIYMNLGSARKKVPTTTPPTTTTTTEGTTTEEPYKVFGFDLEKALKQCKIIPEVLDHVPKYVIQVLYENDSTPDLGAYLRPEDMEVKPYQIKWPKEDDYYYTILMVDPDVPTRIDISEYQWLNWMITNIHNETWEDKDIIAPYLGPEPNFKSGLHRVLYLCYRQPGKLEFKERRYDKDREDERRAKFKVNDFVKKYKLGPPYAINFFFCENWDYNIDEYPD